MSEEISFARVRVGRERITAGSGPEDDIVVFSCGIVHRQFCFNMKDRTVTSLPGSVTGCLNGAEVTNTADFETGDVFTAGELTIVFHDRFMMIKDDPAVFHSFERYEGTEEIPLRYPKMRTKTKRVSGFAIRQISSMQRAAADTTEQRHRT